MRVLVGCEFSGIVREAFKAAGHDAWSCDLLDTEIPGQHIKDDVLNHLNDGWDLAIFHPPCTYLCNSGVRWLTIGYKNGFPVFHNQRLKNMDEASDFFKTLLNAPIKHICVENPIPHQYAIDNIGRKYDQIIQPWEHGHGETKATCLWLKNLPLLVPSNIVDGRQAKVWKSPDSKDRWKRRSRTYAGIGKAFATQWGNL